MTAMLVVAAIVSNISVVAANPSLPLTDLMKQSFSDSLTSLFNGYMLGSQLVMKPGLAKMIKEESDRKWEEGLGYAKKYFQRGGKEYTAFSNAIKGIESAPGDSSALAGGAYNKYFQSSLTRSAHRSQEQYEALKDVANKHKSDPDLTNFLQQNADKEMKIRHELNTLKTSLDKLAGQSETINGMAMHIFDQSL